MPVPPDPSEPRTDEAVPRPPRRSLVTVVTALLLVVVAGGVLGIAVGQGDRVLPNTRVGGVAIGRLAPSAALRTLEVAQAEGRLPPVPTTVVITTPDGVVTLATADLGLRLDLEASTVRALARGRSGRPADVAERVRSLRRVVDLRPVLTADPAAVRAAVDRVATALDREPHPGDLRIDPRTLEVATVPPRAGVTVRREESVERILAGLTTGDRRSVTLAADVSPAPAPRAAIEDLAARLRTALAADLILVRDGRRVAVTPTELAAAVTVVPHPDDRGRVRPALRLDPVVLARGPGPRIAATFQRDAADAELVVPAAEQVFTAMGTTSFAALPAPVRLDPGRTGLVYRMDLTALQLEGMVRSGRRVASAALQEIPADRPPDELSRHPVPTHLIGTFTTFHPAGAPRTENIRRLADTIDATLVAPGEEFSINATSGARRCEDGYVLAGTIVRGELVDTCGGGVSQFGTTTYNAAFFAGLPITAGQPHSFYISRYPMGREATLSYPELDVRFRNDTPGWIVIRTSHTPTSVTVSLFGVPVWAEVSAVHSAPRDPRPFATEFRTALDLPPGRERTVQDGGGGFTVDVRRVRVPLAGGAPVVEDRRTVYLPQARIVLVGTAADAGGGADAGAGGG